jgi:hypothetical protein
MGKLGEQTAALVDQISEVAGSRPRSGGASAPAPAPAPSPEPRPPEPPEPRPPEPPEPSAASSPSTAASPPTAATPPASPDGAGPAVTSLAIPDYDSLAASQVLSRLAGLSADELEAVRLYEAAHRGRKTILSRIAQLQA